MSLQNIIDKAVTLQVDRKKVSGQTISRSGLVKTSSIASHVPWRFKVEFHSGLRFSESREIIEELDRVDRVLPQTINIGASNPALSYITEYRGDFPNVVSSATLVSHSGLNIVLNVPATGGGSGTGTLLFRAGDLITFDGHKYPYSVTRDVKYSGSSITVPVNRPVITLSDNPVGKTLMVGSDVTWEVVLVKRPAWRVIPYDRVEFDGAFEFIEQIS